MLAPDHCYFDKIDRCLPFLLALQAVVLGGCIDERYSWTQ
jgi:hypothetical protein